MEWSWGWGQIRVRVCLGRAWRCEQPFCAMVPRQERAGSIRAASTQAGDRIALSLCPILVSHIWWLHSSKMTQSKQSSNPRLPFLSAKPALNKNTSGSHLFLHLRGAVPQATGSSQTINCPENTFWGLGSKALFICTANKLLNLVL